MAETKDSELRGLFGCRDVDFEAPNGATLRVQVYGLAIAQVRKFSSEILTVFRTMLPTLKVTVDDTKTEQERTADIISQVALKVAPVLMNDLCGLIGSCVKFQLKPKDEDKFKPISGSFDDLPHERGVAVAHAWFKESFEDPKKLEPWKEMISSLQGLKDKGLSPTLGT